ncbi:LGFP repeat-containing protein [Blastococcus sp. URHD0036]|uniref:LGFP repeat-containing protein n=1 Tax=Blastococcus sp. URHD0036 TaxID=1380356 RepID=UPI00068AD1A8|nr:hypothetical protein [Blastococcus sp. URHD0036]
MLTSAPARRRSLATVLSAAAFAVALLLGTPQAVADIYRSPAGTYEVKGAILAEYRALGGPDGFLGFPLTNELTTPIRTEGRFSVFQHGSIYWTPATGAHEVHGAIGAEWGHLGWENGVLGFPVTDELSTPDGRGRFNYFERGGIYWTPSTGAHEVHGAILEQWAAQGWERGAGYPLTDELSTPTKPGRFNHFEHASIYWSPTTGAYTVYSNFRALWASMGWENSCLGFPISNANRGFQSFQGGSIAIQGSGELYASCR